LLAIARFLALPVRDPPAARIEVGRKATKADWPTEGLPVGRIAARGPENAQETVNFSAGDAADAEHASFCKIMARRNNGKERAEAGERHAQPAGLLEISKRSW